MKVDFDSIEPLLTDSYEQGADQMKQLIISSIENSNFINKEDIISLIEPLIVDYIIKI